MAFSVAQLDRIRTRLCAYRAQNGNNGRPRPWKSVLNDILMSEKTAHCYPEDGSEPEFKEEALRRFAAGTSIPSLDKVEDIQALLVEQKYLTKESLEEGVWDYSVALSLRNLFGEAKYGRDLTKAFQGEFLAEIPEEQGDLQGTARYELTVNAVDRENILELKMSWFKWLYGDAEKMKSQKKYDEQIRIQDGYGFLSNNSEITIFFKDGFTGKMDIYVLSALNAIQGNEPVAWFQAAKVNHSFEWGNKLPANVVSPLELKSFVFTNLHVQEQGHGD